MVPLLIAFVCLYFARSARASRSQLAALAVLCGGGLGNWLDRVLHDGAVTDFVSLGFGHFRTGIFNLADLAIIAGIFWLIAATRHREAPLPEADSLTDGLLPRWMPTSSTPAASS